MSETQDSERWNEKSCSWLFPVSRLCNQICNYQARVQLLEGNLKDFKEEHRAACAPLLAAQWAAQAAVLAAAYTFLRQFENLFFILAFGVEGLSN